MEKTVDVLQLEGMEYLVCRPSGYRAGERYPVVLFLHGAGTRGDDIALLRNNPFMREVVDRYADYGFITVAPHCKHGTWFDHFERLRRLTHKIAHAPDTDPERLYLIGNSMGGYGTWQLAMSMPEYFAAILPICGGGMAWNTSQLVNVPVWAFHGERDTVVSPDESRRMVEALRARGGDARLTVYPEAAHDAWTPTFADAEVFAWLFSKRNRNEIPLTDPYSADSVYG